MHDLICILQGLSEGTGCEPVVDETAEIIRGLVICRDRASFISSRRVVDRGAERDQRAVAERLANGIWVSDAAAVPTFVPAETVFVLVYCGNCAMVP